jgi:glutamine amidotransferase-like uncharacterized protein
MTKTKPLFLVYVEHPMCNIDCADGVRDVLENSREYTVLLVGPSSFPYKELSEKLLHEATCLIIPGGIGESDQYDNSKLKTYAGLIKNYVACGGRYLGICMGSYFAGHHYLSLLKKDTRVVQYVKRKDAVVHHEKPAVIELMWEDSNQHMYFADGAAFVPRRGSKHISGEIVARYMNSDPAAIIQSHRKGRVGVIGPHPEAHKWWFYTENNIRDRWQDCIKHHLLLDFVKKLL